MSTFLFASSPIPAHTANAMPFAARLIDSGHRVLWYSGRKFHRQIEALGATPIAYSRALDFSGRDIRDVYPEFADLPTVKAVRHAFATIFVGHAADRITDLRDILAEHEVDAMMSDGLMYGVGLTSELTGIPWATFGDGPLPYFEPDTPPFGPGLSPMRGPVGRLRNKLVGQIAKRFIFADAQQVFDRTRRDFGLPATGEDVLEAATSPYLHLQGATPGFDYPRKNLPEHLYWVGALRPDPPRDWAPPAWWPEVVASMKPVVVVSQGSIRPDVTELLIPTIRALVEENCLVVVTTGSATPDQLAEFYGGPLPQNVRVTDFIPYDVLFEHASMFVTNGGYTGVTLALSHGLPLVQAGNTEEKNEIAARIRFAGVGVTLGTTHPSSDAIHRAVRSVWRDSSYPLAARRVAAEMAHHDAGREGAALLARLARSKTPVRRSELAENWQAQLDSSVLVTGDSLSAASTTSE